MVETSCVHARRRPATARTVQLRIARGTGTGESSVTSHPLRAIRSMVDEALKDLSDRFDEIYGEDGRKSIPPERLLRALLLQMFYSVRSERMLMEQME